MKKTYEVKRYNRNSHILINSMTLTVTPEWFRGFWRKAVITASKSNYYLVWHEVK